MTKGQRNELARKQFDDRVKAVNKKGLTLKSHVIGDRRYADSWSYYIYQKGESIHPGTSFDYAESALKWAEEYIIKNNL